MKRNAGEVAYGIRTLLFLAFNTVLQVALVVALCRLWSPLAGVWQLLVVAGLMVLGYNYATAVTTLGVALMARRPVVRRSASAPSSTSSMVAVAIPCLLSSKPVINELLRRLADHRRSSPHVKAVFVLLADFMDSREAEGRMSEEERELLQHAIVGIDRLNRELAPCFGLLVRARRWASTDHVWMGHERKRGKIEAFNRFLLDPRDCDFETVHCDRRNLTGVSCVLTLDADSVLPNDTLQAMVRLIDDPANARFVMIQPGLRPVPEEPKNWYQWITASPFPPLTILQSVFGRSKFVGKGMYRVREFQALVTGRVPENWVLSHDVLESCLMPVGSVDDVVIRESHPVTFAEARARLHRWYRGDWQNLPWALPCRVRSMIPEFRRVVPAKIGAAGAWMVADLAARDLHAPCLLMLLFTAFRLPSELAVVGALFACEVSLMAVTLASKQLRAEASTTLEELVRVVCGSVYFWMALPIHGWICVDAAARAFWRMFVSRQRRLEWTASAEFRATQAEQATTSAHTPSLVAAALGLLCGVLWSSHAALLLALLWLSQPVVQKLLERRSPASVVASEDLPA